MPLDGKVALITGGASGIGLVTAQRFGEMGAKLCIATSNDEKITAAVPRLENMGFNVAGIHVDVRQMNSVQSMVDEAISNFGKVDILICSHGYSHFGDVIDQPEDEWMRVLDTDLTGCYRCRDKNNPTPFCINH